jgi:hypothetical protein
MVNWIRNYTGQNVHSTERQELTKLKKEIERYKKKQIKQEEEDNADRNSSDEDVNIIILNIRRMKMMKRRNKIKSLK